MKEIKGRIRCSGTFHTVGIDRDGRPFASHHGVEEIQALEVSASLSGIEIDLPCLQFLKTARDCIRKKRLPEHGEFPRIIEDFMLRRRAEHVALLRKRQERMERKVKEICRFAEVALREDIDRMMDDLQDIDRGISTRFGGEMSPGLRDAYEDATERLGQRTSVLKMRDLEK